MDAHAERVGAGGRSPLGARLRTETREAHVAAEAAFDLDRRLASLTAYGEGLRVMEAFDRLCALISALADPWLSEELRDGRVRRRARMHADLAALGEAPARASAGDGAAVLGQTMSCDHALGVVYVQEGAALGGLRIAAEVRRRLPAATPATTYFTGEGRATACRWRAVQAILGQWSDPDGPAADRVLAGAHSVFAALTALSAEPCAKPG